MCPECDAAFIDFEDGDCFALKCGRCAHNFCGFCIASCESSAAAHKHVGNCEYNLNHGGGGFGGKNIFGPFENFERARTLRRQRLVEQYFNRLDKHTRHQLLEHPGIKQDLADVQIDVLALALMQVA